MSYPISLEHEVAIPKRERFPERYFGAKAYLAEKMEVNGRLIDVLVQRQVIPMGSRLRFSVEREFSFFPYLTDWKKVVGHSKPFFRTKVLSIPDDAKIQDAVRSELLAREFLVNTTDLAPDRIVALRELSRASPGDNKREFPLPWDDWNPSGTWARAIEEALSLASNRHLLSSPPADISYFCPAFSRLEPGSRMQFFQNLLAEMSWRESSFVPFTFSDEGKYTSGAEGVMSTGLLQLSIGSTRSACYQERGCRAIRGQRELFDPLLNLRCGVAVISCLVSRDSCLSCKDAQGSWRGASRYWSVLREKHTRSCPSCFKGSVTLGKKEELQELFRQTLPFCWR